MQGYVVVLVVAAVTTYLLAFVVRRGAVRLGAVVLPDDRRVHASPTPTSGGVAMFAAVVVAMAVASRLPQFRPVFDGSSEPLGVLLAAGVIFLVGLVDDVRDVSAPAKLAGQVLAGSVLYFLGVTMFYFRVPFLDIVSISPDLAPLLTVVWVAAIANAVNLIDGLDGLAAGIVAIAAAAFFVYGDRLSTAGLLPPENVGPLVAIIACGVCLGFLPHNFHPARIFMGDAGSLLLGLLMACSTMVVGGRTADQFAGQTYFFFAPIFIPVFVLGVPILDTAFAIVRRSVRRSRVSAPDKEHLHHRLMRLGHGHQRSVVILWAWTAILSGLVLLPTFTNEGNAVIPFALAGLVVALYTLFHPGVRQRAETEAEARAEADDRRAQPAEVDLADVVELAERRRGTGGP
ncbi:MAG: undecaprenyl/decaprenyl-phosphate alpha-N-acetylglucosaminyl 1-phosphate transferase [Actinomycetota bacterium]|nr:undecaprenyl/decaprenyl-phosphate alpha-N-acetylglucosaminyl 1-phosphate transferase [Actinomycetota bacterium]